MSTPSNTRSADGAFGSSTSTGDLKEALGSRRKPDTTHVRYAFIVYTARACEYGDDKYERANYRRPTGGKAHGEPTAEDFKRFRAYLRAAKDHVEKVLDAMELHQAGDYHLTDVEGMRRACYAADTDETPGNKIGASRLPHVSPAAASLNMAITQAVDCGLLPADPGAPWLEQAKGRTTTERSQDALTARRWVKNRTAVCLKSHPAAVGYTHGYDVLGVTVRWSGGEVTRHRVDELDEAPVDRWISLDPPVVPKAEPSEPKARQWQVGDRVRVTSADLHGKIGTVRGHGRPGIVHLQLDEDGPLGSSLRFGENEIEAAPVEDEAPIETAQRWYASQARVRRRVAGGPTGTVTGFTAHSTHDPRGCTVDVKWPLDGLAKHHVSELVEVPEAPAKAAPPEPKARQWQVGDRVRVRSTGLAEWCGRPGTIAECSATRGFVYVRLDGPGSPLVSFRDDDLVAAPSVTAGHVRMGDKGAP